MADTNDIVVESPALATMRDLTHKAVDLYWTLPLDDDVRLTAWLSNMSDVDLSELRWHLDNMSDVCATLIREAIVRSRRQASTGDDC